LFPSSDTNKHLVHLIATETILTRSIL